MKLALTFPISIAIISIPQNVYSFESNLQLISSQHIHRTTLSATQLKSDDEIDINSIKEAVKSNNKINKYSQAIPFLNRPAVLKGELAGDFGFDPLQFSKNREELYYYREAEIKHARLAMLAAAGWPISELFDAKIAAYFGLAPVIDSTTDRVPSLLNGGLENISPKFWGFCLGFSAAIDLYGIQRVRNMSTEEEQHYIPGDFKFDPLGLYPTDVEKQKDMQLAEIKHGRVAMMAVAGFAAQEAILHLGIIDETPQFFFPAF